MAESRVKRATTSYMKVNVRTDRLGVTDLKVDWISLPQPRFNLGDRTDGVPLEVVKVRDSVFVEERPSHCPMKSNEMISASRL